MMSPSTSTINRMCPEPECCGPTLKVRVCAPESEVSVDSTVVNGTGFAGADIAVLSPWGNVFPFEAVVAHPSYLLETASPVSDDHRTVFRTSRSFPAHNSQHQTR